MGILRSIIEIFVRAMLNRRRDLALGGSIGSELVGDHLRWRATLPLHEADQQTLGGFGDALALDDLIKHISVLVDVSPEPVLPAGNGEYNLVEMPDVAAARGFALEAAGVVRPNLESPATDSLLRR